MTFRRGVACVSGRMGQSTRGPGRKVCATAGGFSRAQTAMSTTASGAMTRSMARAAAALMTAAGDVPSGGGINTEHVHTVDWVLLGLASPNMGWILAAITGNLSADAPCLLICKACNHNNNQHRCRLPHHGYLGIVLTARKTSMCAGMKAAGRKGSGAARASADLPTGTSIWAVVCERSERQRHLCI